MRAFILGSDPSAISGVDGMIALLHRLPMSDPSASSEIARAELIRAIAVSADRSAFISLFTFYAPRIKAQAMRFGLDAAAAEDVVQDAMLSVWRRAAQFDPQRGSASAWVFAIATNARIDRIRRDNRVPVAADLDTSGPLLTEDADESGADASRMLEMVSALPPEQRRIIQMSFYADLPHAEIAARLNIPLGTVKSRIRLAIARMRQALSEKL